jgi:hypothetical protein
VFGRTVSDYDCATIIHHPDGAREIVMPGVEAGEEAARLARAHYETVATAKLAADQRDARIGQRARAFIVAGPGQDEVDTAGLTRARAGLVRHLGWLDKARRLADAAQARLDMIAQAVDRWERAQAALNLLDKQVALAFDAWVKFGSEGDPPLSRAGERQQLCIALDDVAPMAALADDARFEADVVEAVVGELTAMLPGLRFDVLLEAAGPIEARIRELVEKLAEAYGSLAALRALTGLQKLPKPGKLVLPSLPSGACGFEVAAGQDALIAWTAALGELEAHPRGGLPDDEQPPERIKSSRFAAAYRRILATLNLSRISLFRAER